jgi:hypothetical protein
VRELTDRATDYPPRFQFEASSGSLVYSQIYNCGPTGAAQQIDYYLGKKGTTHIEGLRYRIGIDRGKPTTAWEQSEMLRAMGIPSYVVQIDRIAQLNDLLGYGMRPIGIGVEMSRLPDRMRGHTFEGWHRITLLRRRKRWSKRKGRWIEGYIYTDPNFSAPGGHRTDPYKGHRFISRYWLNRVFIQNFPAWAIVPLKKKGA